MRCATLLIALTLLAPGPLALLAPGPAAAAPVTLTQAGQPALYKPGGHPIDILGITPGMAPLAVRDILTKQYGNAVVTQEEISLDNHGTVVQSQTFITRIGAHADNDEITVWFATPTTGNGVVEVSRQLSFRDETAAPALAQVVTDLITQYGKPGFNGAAVGSGEVQLMAWSFSGNKPNGCPHSSCRTQLSEGLDIRALPAYTRSVKAGNDLTIVATLLAGISDPSRASGIVLVMSDAATKMHTLETAIAQMRAASAHK